ncbi:hypothetical protein [Paenibacillus swuensis]|nr:hypothetical protein [Paenibacillus swuensis]
MLFIALAAIYAAFTYSNSQVNEPDLCSYKPSALHSEFPVPAAAKPTNHKSNNPDIRYIRYTFEGVRDESSIPPAYVTEIERRGWVEDKDAQMGGLRVFEKTGMKINFVQSTDFFTLFTDKS